MKNGRRRLTVLLAIALIAPAFLASPASADGKKLQVIQDSAVVRLDPSERSPAVETLNRGAILSLASAVKMKVCWFYVYFTSLQSGNTRSGYVHESCVRKLFPSLKVIQITSGDEIVNPTQIDLESSYKPNVEWGTRREELIRAEGRPQTQDASQGVEILVYRREIMKKKCQVEYVFDDGSLVSTRFRLMENYADKNRYIEDYNKLRQYLTATVGAPRADRTVWQDRFYENQNDCWGIALSQGQVEFSSEWVFRDTEVRLTLAGANNHVLFGAELNDNRLKKPTSF
ncbi:MAG: hypothetical protein ABR951_12085 [Candidatus Aminicenantales bacterium]|jgi:hypothetical protein